MNNSQFSSNKEASIQTSRRMSLIWTDTKSQVKLDWKHLKIMSSLKLQLKIESSICLLKTVSPLKTHLMFIHCSKLASQSLFRQLTLINLFSRKLTHMKDWNSLILKLIMKMLKELSKVLKKVILKRKNKIKTKYQSNKKISLDSHCGLKMNFSLLLIKLLLVKSQSKDQL